VTPDENAIQPATRFAARVSATYPMRLRFTIRDLLWLTLVVAILLAWRFYRPTPTAGRYQWIGMNGDNSPMIMDTADGSIWWAHRQDGRNWL